MTLFKSIRRSSKAWTICLAFAFLVAAFATPAIAQQPTEDETNVATIPKKYQHCALVLMGEEEIDGPSAIMILGIGSTILHTIAASGLSILSKFLKPLRDPTGSKQTGVSESVATVLRFVVYYLLAAVAAAWILSQICHLEVLGALGFQAQDHTYFGFKIDKHGVDAIWTGVIMWLGAERVGHWLQIPGGPASQPLHPIVISGNIELQEPAA